MANPWFRMYAEFATDPKVQMLSENYQRRLTMLLCLRCNEHVTLQDKEVTFLLRISNDEWLATKAIFISSGFINNDNKILNWDKRQFKSDTSKNRVSAYRERNKKSSNKDVTLQKRKCNAIDTDTDTDTDINTNFEKFYSAYPKKKSKASALKAWVKLKPPIEDVLKALSWQTKSTEWTKENGQFIQYPASYLNAGAWQDEPITKQSTFRRVSL